MVVEIPEGVYTMGGKLVIINHNAKAYQKASKKVKTQMIKELSKILHMNKQYLALLLRKGGRVIARDGRNVVVADLSISETYKRGRKRVYGWDIERALRRIWPLTGFSSSKHLVAFIRLNHELLFNHPELKGHMSEKIKSLLLKMSASTADRLLKPYRDKLKLKKRYRGNPFSSNLKKSIKVESWFDRPKEPGYLEIDLVHHSGASGKGEFIYTLTATEVLTGWTEIRPIRNKAMVWTKQALEDIVKSMPVPIKKIHSDNGSEFINAHVQRFCRMMGIEFTRSRPYRKNDSPYVESKNWSMVRAYTGWRRYDTEEELEILKKLERLIAIRQNIFMPQMKLTYRQREGSKVVKTYEMDIPLRRVLNLEGVNAEAKQRLVKLRNSIDIVRLSEEIERLSEDLSIAYENKFRRFKYA